MPIEKVNITDDQNAETNVDWIATGERMTEQNLNRPVKQVAQVLNNAIDDIESEFANLTIGTSNALQQEITDRTNADNALQSNIDAEIQNRTDADNAEQTARINADNDLQANIDQEIQNRTNTDNALQANINNEEAARISADNALQAAINLINSNGLPASIISTIDQFAYSDSGNVQDVLDDLDHAINQIITSNPTSDVNGSSGYVKIPASGRNILIQFGRHVNSRSSWNSNIRRGSITYPIAFPTAMLSTNATIFITQTYYGQIRVPNPLLIRSATTSSFDFHLVYDDDYHSFDDFTIHWIAIGH